jgi:aromatic ring-opening dioxygenase LigB subunit
MSFNYPVSPTAEDKRHYRDFILNLQYVLPCGKCRKNLKKNFARVPLRMADMASRETFSKYIYRLHELVNRMLNKRSGLTYEMVRERYEHFRARCAIPFSEMSSQPQVKDEHGCTVPLYGEKSKCVLKIVPDHVKCETMEIDKQCIKRAIPLPKQ